MSSVHFEMQGLQNTLAARPHLRQAGWLAEQRKEPVLLLCCIRFYNLHHLLFLTAHLLRVQRQLQDISQHLRQLPLNARGWEALVPRVGV